MIRGHLVTDVVAIIGTLDMSRRGGSLALSTTLHSVLVFMQTWWVELLCALLIVLVVPLIAATLFLSSAGHGGHAKRASARCASARTACWQPVADALKLLIKEDPDPQ